MKQAPPSVLIGSCKCCNDWRWCLDFYSAAKFCGQSWWISTLDRLQKPHYLTTISWTRSLFDRIQKRLALIKAFLLGTQWKVPPWGLICFDYGRFYLISEWLGTKTMPITMSCVLSNHNTETHAYWLICVLAYFHTCILSDLKTFYETLI